MIDILLTIVILLLLGFVAYLIYMHQQEREKLLKMIMSKDLRDLTASEVLDKLPKQEPEKPSDNVSMDDVVEDEVLFDRHIAAVKAAAKEEIRKEHEV